MKSKALIAIILAVLLSIGGLGYLSFDTISYAQSEFALNGYILSAVNSKNEEDDVNTQYYFNAGEKFLSKQDETITFKTVNGDRVNVNKENFIHYTDSSMSSMAKSVILDADSLYNDTIVYYSISKDSLIEKRTNGYAIFNGAEVLNLSNFIWKLSEKQYMLVSNSIKLVVDEGSTQTFNGFIQLLYKDSGVVYLINQEGTYSTISSAAYLELENGVRVYIGSKNVSDSEGILMNLTQMLVSSDDDIETNPDEEFKKEIDVQPRIQIDANDGEDGENGVDGKVGLSGNDGAEGESGDQGDAGAPGKNGPGGEPGKNASTAAMTYEEAKAPQFEIGLSPLAYGVEADITYDDRGCNITASTVEIIETATGNLIWSSAEGTEGYVLGTAVGKGYAKCYTLRPNTNYTFNILCTYNGRTANVASKYFTTLSLGLDLEVTSVDQHTINGQVLLSDELIAAMESDDILFEKFGIKCYDKDKKFLGYAKVTGTAATLGVEDTGLISAAELKNNNLDRVNIYVDDLVRNSVYYLRITDVTVNSSATGSEKIADIVTTDSFPYVMAKTLKQRPSLGKPEVMITEKDSAFSITPTNVLDADGGVLSYVYEVYDLSAFVANVNGEYIFNADPVYSVQKTEPTEILVPIINKNEDSKKGVYRNVDYVARIVANFDNNQMMTQYSSPLTDAFSAGNTVMPTADIIWNGGTLTASSRQGTIIIRDKYNAIDPKYGIEAKYTIVNSDREISGVIHSYETALSANENLDGYTIPIFIYGLEAGEQYQITVHAGKVKAPYLDENDKLTGETTQNLLNYALAVDTFTTEAQYDPIRLNAIKKNDGGVHAFSFNLSLSLGTEKDSTAVSEPIASSAGLHDMSSYSAKSLNYLKFDIYRLNKVTAELEAMNHSYVLSGQTLTSYEDYKFGDTEDSLYSKYYCPTYTSDAGVYNINESVFSAYLTSELNDDDQLYIKVTGYDYCYDAYSNSPYNRIQITKGAIENGVDVVDYYSNGDAYICITVKPAFPGQPSDIKTVPIKKSQAVGDIFDSSNMTADNANSLWENLNSDTTVGVQISGSGEFNPYAKAIRYSIYTTMPEYEANDSSGGAIKTSSVLVKQSPDIPIENNATTYPVWTYFFTNNGDEINGNTTLSRGDDYYIVTEFVLDQRWDDTEGNSRVYPTDFMFDIQMEEIPEDKRALIIHRLENKQVPKFVLSEYKGSVDITTRAITTEYYVDYMDVDHALITTDAGICFYVHNSHDKEDYVADYRSGIKLVENTVTGKDQSGASVDVFKYKFNEPITLHNFEHIYPGQIYSEHIYAGYYPDNNREKPYKLDLANADNVIFVGDNNARFIAASPGAEGDDKTDLDFAYYKRIDQLPFKYSLTEEDATSIHPEVVKVGSVDYVKFMMYVATDCPDSAMFTNLDLIFRNSSGTEDIVFENVDFKESFNSGSFTSSVAGIQYNQTIFQVNAFIRLADLQERIHVDTETFSVTAKLYYVGTDFGVDVAKGGTDPALYALQYYGSKMFVEDGDLEVLKVQAEPGTSSTYKLINDVPSDKVYYANLAGLTPSLVTSSGVLDSHLHHCIPDDNSAVNIDMLNTGVNNKHQSGLSFIPRNMKCATISSDVHIGQIFGDMAVNLVVGIEEATINLTISNNNWSPDTSVGQDSALYGKKAYIAIWPEANKESMLSAATNSFSTFVSEHPNNVYGLTQADTNVVITKGAFQALQLSPNTKYCITAWVHYDNRWNNVTNGYGKDAIVNWSIFDAVTTGRSTYQNSIIFKSIQRVNIAPTAMKFSWYESAEDQLSATAMTYDADSRNNKFIDVTYQIQNAKSIELNAVTGFVVTVTNTSTGAIVATHTYGGIENNEWKTISDAFNAIAVNAEDKYTYTGVLEHIPFKPSVDHELATTNYKATIQVLYEHFEDRTEAVYTKKFSSLKNKGSVQMVLASGGVARSASGASIECTLTASDPLRVFLPTKAGINTYELEAKIELKNTGNMADVLQIKKVNLLYNPQTGDIDPVNFTFTEVPVGSYRIYSTIYADFNNDGIKEEYEVSSTCKVESYIEGIALNDVYIVNDNNDPRALLVGSNLNKIGYVSYTLTKLVNNKPTVITYHGPVDGNAANDKYYPNVRGVNSAYYLHLDDVPSGFFESTGRYSIDVEIFVSQNDYEISNPAAWASGTYIPEQSETPSANLKSLGRRILSALFY